MLNVILISLYTIFEGLLTLYSWGFVDANGPFLQIRLLVNTVRYQRDVSTLIYVILFAALFLLYIWVLYLIKKKLLDKYTLIKLVGISSLLFFIGFPGFSYDVFNYMATAKVTYFWKENPYIVMPIEIPNEPMLGYMHAANKVALYGPAWILITFIPHTLGYSNPLVTVYMFKGIVLLFYLGMSYLLWHVSERNVFALAFFALNPLVMTETILSGHNDIVMMFFALLAFYLLRRKNMFPSFVIFVGSIFIKYATLLLIPIYSYVFLMTLRDIKIQWRSVWYWSAIAMFIAFILSPVREEIYAWYFIWPLTFLSLIEEKSLLVWASYGFTLGLPFRIAPFLYWGQWGGWTPMVKKIVTFVPSLISTGYGYTKNLR